jgi:hypothetical protein
LRRTTTSHWHRHEFVVLLLMPTSGFNQHIVASRLAISLYGHQLAKGDVMLHICPVSLMPNCEMAAEKS